MKILVLANFGMGLFKFRKELLQRLVSDGHDVHISIPEDEYTVLIQEIGVKTHNIKLNRRGINPIEDLGLLKDYILIIKSIKPDIVLTYTIKPNIFGGLACRLTNTPYLINITGLGTAIENKGPINKIVMSLYKSSLKDAKTIFFQNEYNLQFLKNKLNLANPIILLPGSGVNLKEYIPVEYPEIKDTVKFLFIGRVMKDKGIEEIIEVAKEIQKKASVEFHIVGGCDENYQEELTELTKKNILHYHGQQTDVKPFIESAHALLLPSYHEGTANVLLEGAAMGRPLLASNIPGCKEIIDQHINGLLFKPRFSKSLLDAIMKFLELTYEEKTSYAKKSRKKVEEEYDRNIVVRKYIEVIHTYGGRK